MKGLGMRKAMGYNMSSITNSPVNGLLYVRGKISALQTLLPSTMPLPLHAARNGARAAFARTCSYRQRQNAHTVVVERADCCACGRRQCRGAAGRCVGAAA